MKSQTGHLRTIPKCYVFSQTGSDYVFLLYTLEDRDFSQEELMFYIHYKQYWLP